MPDAPLQRARVVAAHRAPDRPAIRIARGEQATLGERDDAWPGFVWSTLASGLGGWIPLRLFDGDHDTATAIDDYDTRELDADAGEILQLHRELAGWWWAENKHGATGWIPARTIESIDED